MSQSHTDIEPESDAQRENESGELERFSRNRYFNGKLMTARDMQAEQAYHARRLETLAQHVLGEGVVCGLDTTVTVDNGGISVSIDPGLAIDAYGRPVVVDGSDKVPFTDEEVPDGGGFSLFIELEPCDAEKVPIPGSQDACSENCEYNRVIEDYTVRLEAGRPADRKPVPDVEFPTDAELAEPNTHDDADEPHQRLSDPARTYAGGTDAEGRFEYDACAEGGDASVFLGYYEEDAGEWERLPEAEPRHQVYTNDMLYASIVGHAADFDNPHEVHLAVEELAGGVETIVRNERHDAPAGDPPYPGDVALSSPDDTLAIAGSMTDGIGAVTLDLGDDEQEILGKVEPLETDVRDHLEADNPHDAVTAIAGDGEAVEPSDGIVGLVSGDGINVEPSPEDNEVGIGLEGELVEELVRGILEELVGPVDPDDWERVRSAIRSVNGVESDEAGGIQLASETETVAIDEDPDANTISIDIGPETLDRLDQLEQRLDTLESDGVDLSDVDLTDYLPDYDRLLNQVDRLDTFETELQSVTDQYSTLDSQVTTLDDQYSTLDSQVDTINQDLKLTATAVDDISNELESQFDSTSYEYTLRDDSNLFGG